MKTAEEIIRDKGQEIISVSPDTTIRDALKLMVEKKIGAILVMEEGAIAGIWTERDLMRNTLVEGFDPKTAKISDYMSKNLITAPHTDSVYNLMEKFLGNRIRHLLIEKNGEFIGLISSGDCNKASLIEKSEELKDLKAVVNWEYYENWRWKKK
jgi:CBS domain-containing protein